MQARDIMTRPVITFGPGASIRYAAAVLTEHNITAAPVVDEENEIIGIVSEADLIADRFPHDPRSSARRDTGEPAEPDAARTVGEVMTTAVVAMSETADAADLAEMMVTCNVRSIPIVIGSTVIGIVSRRDLLRTLVRDDDIIAAEVRQRVEAYNNGRTDWQITSQRGRVDITGEVDDDAEGRVIVLLAHTVPGVAHVELHSARRSATARRR